jgi:hypothetical protein
MELDTAMFGSAGKRIRQRKHGGETGGWKSNNEGQQESEGADRRSRCRRKLEAK